MLNFSHLYHIYICTCLCASMWLCVHIIGKYFTRVDISNFNIDLSKSRNISRFQISFSRGIVSHDDFLKLFDEFLFLSEEPINIRLERSLDLCTINKQLYILFKIQRYVYFAYLIFFREI